MNIFKIKSMNHFNLKSLNRTENYYKFILMFIFIVGFFVRLFHLSTLPIGLNQDEAYAGYEAYSLLNYGFDSHGYANPVYFISWGSGMNVLYSYLTIPFLFLTGNNLTTFAIRLPQAVFSCLSIAAFYLLLKRLYSDKWNVLLGLFVFAVVPWHIMLSHWGLESNIAPAFLLFGLLFGVMGMENSKFYILSALMYGLSLYAYAPLWMAVPVIILLQFIYSIYCKKLKWDRFFTVAILLLFFLALPLMLFLLINMGVLPEIKTGIISIPRLLEYRGGEISLNNIKLSAYNFYSLMINQNDDLIWNSTQEFGIYYKFSIVFIVIGLCSIAKTTFYNLKSRSYHPKTFIYIHILVSIVFALLISNINVNKINMIHIPLIICCVQGIITASSLFKKPVYSYVVLAYAVSFVAFSSYYFTLYNVYIQEPFQYGVQESVHAAMAKTDAKICINQDIFYSNVLFATEIPVTNYLKTVEYDPNTPSDSTPVSFDRFEFGYDANHPDTDTVYIISNDEINVFTDNNFTIETYGNYAVAYFTK